MKKQCTLLAAAMLVAAAVIAGCGSSKQAAEPKKDAPPVTLHVAAAASLTDAMKELAENYKKEHPNTTLEFQFGSSGALQKSIQEGGEADLFFSAAQKQMNALEEAGELLEGTRKDLLVNEVVLIMPKDGKKTLTGYEDLAKPEIEKVAVGDKGVPVGQYTEEIFKKLNLTDAVMPKATLASDVRQVLTYVEQGEVDAGIVYATDAVAPNFKNIKIVAKAPEGSHKPVIYPGAVLKASKNADEAKAFLAFVSSPESAKVFEKYGFELAK
ncbi:molybdate ABC transporter substrate-binding protein [Selenomonas sp. TAMA-11512]|uniref:molybdate ABC transporter substrate-binding protein n=1 Tax=Selenomonas sp. TAMA-11512 TaxID=3095337 RepID=UPI0030880503|nr:molybdate ABC transporter substrate-binding protein [Selenomonas sp. TAMA-11512]